MKLFLCSNFKCLAPKYLPKFFDANKEYKCLFVGYADEDKDFYSESTVEFLKELGFNVFCLDENYDFKYEMDYIMIEKDSGEKVKYDRRKTISQKTLWVLDNIIDSTDREA